MKEEYERGFIGLVIVLIVSLVLLKYVLNWSILDAINSPKGKETLDYMANLWHIIWGYISEPLLFVWHRLETILNWAKAKISFPENI